MDKVIPKVFKKVTYGAREALWHFVVAPDPEPTGEGSKEEDGTAWLKEDGTQVYQEDGNP